ncbi:intein/intein [Kutzneria buriramensis]|uniref:Intein/intein n=1 Tax=Kutzneria buriramensis TaxID=1045776 RepID=A0A3E0HAM1_9PSEU|nr:intein/intein [Kutzneria buriramensis]
MRGSLTGLAAAMALLSVTTTASVAAVASSDPSAARPADAPTWRSTLGTQARTDRCRVGLVMHAGGPQLKAAADTALAGADADLRTAADGLYYQSGAIGDAYRRDGTDVAAENQVAGKRHAGWEAVLKPYYSDPIPYFEQDIYDYMAKRQEMAYNAINVDMVAKANQAAIDAATTVMNQKKAADATVYYFGPLVINGRSADDIRQFLQYGGFPKTAPTPGSAEFRMEVEALKVRYASCDSANPADPSQVLGTVVSTANAEWEAEYASQAPQRATLVAAELQASKDLKSATDAMIEAVGQAAIVSRLLDWQRQWTSPSQPGYPSQALLAQAASDLATAKQRVAAQVPLAQQAAASAKTQSDTAIAAQAQAGAIAAANGTPYGRGLAYAQQSAQVTAASAAAAQASAAAAQTALNASKAAASDADALWSSASAQAHATQAAFAEAAAKQSADQAHAAAAAAATQAAQAAAAATRAHNDRTTAEHAQQSAQAAANDAHNQRATAESERAKAGAAKTEAENQRAKAQQADADAQAKQQTAASKKADAVAAAGTAAQKRQAAENAESRAALARNNAVAAANARDAANARAAACDAWAAAADGTDAAQGARTAADQARSAANQAASAATSAQADADQAEDAAKAARAAATQADAAASRAQAAASSAQSDANTSHAASLTAHAAAADAIVASDQAARNVQAAKDQADKADAASAQAKADSATARAESDQSQTDAAKTAGQAFAAAEAATAARDSALKASTAANEAIRLGTPFQLTDSSAGMAVLVGQTADTLAQQQANAAKARSDEAARAAQAAADAAAHADASAKAAAQYAANAAADAASALQSVAAARASAAAAAADAQATQQADDATKAIDQQAQTDAFQAGVAARDARNDADAAAAAATDAEKDAASARKAADAATADANAAKAAADKADKDATAAEAAAANARDLAQQAEDAAKRAEQQQRDQDATDALNQAGPGGIDGANVRVDLSGLSRKSYEQLNPCVMDLSDPNSSCDVDIRVHFAGVVFYWAVTCELPNTAVKDCAGHTHEDQIDRKEITDFPVERRIHITRADIARALLSSVEDFIANLVPKVVFGILGDMRRCAFGDWGSCGWTASLFVGPEDLKVGVQAVRDIRVAIATGRDIDAALAALESAALAPELKLALEADAVKAQLRQMGCMVNSFPAGTPVLMADGTHRPIEQLVAGNRVLATNPTTGETTARSVISALHHSAQNLLDVDLNGGGGLTTTRGHRLYVVDKGWKTASNLRPGDRVHARDGSTPSVAAVHDRNGRPDETVYDLTIADVHTFYVLAGSTSVLVHNSDCTTFHAEYNGGGEIWADLIDGVLSMAVERNSSSVSGGQMFTDAMNHFGPDNVKAFSGLWISAMPSNLDAFNANLRAGMSFEDAAANTFTGHMCAKYGLTVVTVDRSKLVGEFGQYTTATPLFSRPAK